MLLSWIVSAWSTLHPFKLREAMHAMRWPQALCVVLTFLRDASSDAELRRWVDYVCGGWPRLDPVERFFFDAERPHTKLAERRLGRSLTQYSRWGFIGTERPQIDVFEKRAMGRYDVATRIDVLRRLARRRGEVRLSEYVAELDGAIGRHQAVLDARAAGLVQHGEKRGARWLWPREGMPVRIRLGDVQVRTKDGSSKTMRFAKPRSAIVRAEPDERGWVLLDAGGPQWRVNAQDLSAALD